MVFQRYLQQQGIGFYTVKSQFKAALVDRLNRTLKEKMWRYFNHVGSYRWLDVLQGLVNAYNSAPQRSLPRKLSPSQVNDRNAHEIWEAQEAKPPQQVTQHNPLLFQECPTISIY